MGDELQRTLQAILEHPAHGDVWWSDIERLFEEGLGARILRNGRIILVVRKEARNLRLNVVDRGRPVSTGFILRIQDWLYEHHPELV